MILVRTKMCTNLFSHCPPILPYILTVMFTFLMIISGICNDLGKKQ
uniref:Uncharacterized protein n=1 Tax=Anguilla anguilla TaxID=7936 RepID=A0A0E9WCU7_ANGAN